jgi:hypothetical protein
VTTNARAARPSGIRQDRREPLDPSEQGHVIDLDPALSEEFLQIPVGQPVAQVPTHGEQDDLRRESESSER